MTSLVEHAEQELERSGVGGRAFNAVLEAVRALEAHGGKPGEVGRLAAMVSTLVARQPLTVLTRHPLEWNDVSRVMRTPMWQSARDPRAFSTDCGRTYTIEDDPDRTEYVSAVPDEWVQALCVKHYLSYQDAIEVVNEYFGAGQMTVEDVDMLDSLPEQQRREFMVQRWPSQGVMVAALLYEPLPETVGSFGPELVRSAAA